MSFNFSTFNLGGNDKQKISQLETQLNSLINLLNHSLNSLDTSNFVQGITIGGSDNNSDINDIEQALNTLNEKISRTNEIISDLTDKIQKNTSDIESLKN